MMWRGRCFSLAVAVLLGSGAAPEGRAEAATATRKAPARDASGECSPGKPCTCSGAEACELTCVSAKGSPVRGCSFACAGEGSCTFHCPEGGCSSRSTGSGATELTCEGGSCSMTCSGSGTCELNDCRSGCRLACNGEGVCENECRGSGCSCTGKNCQ